MLKLGLDTESLHLWLQNKRMDIFGFIEKAHEFGLDGGIGGGALFAGYIYHDEILRIPYIFYGNALIILLAFFYVIYWNSKNKKTNNLL